MLKTQFFKLALLASTTIFTLPSLSNAAEINVYSARQEALIKPLLDTFTQETNIKVNLITGKADELLSRIQLEGKATPADIFITVDAGRLNRAKEADVLQAVESKLLNERIPGNLRDSDKTWFGLSQRARPIFYVDGKVDVNELSTYEDLADPKWEGKICIRSSSNIYNQSLIASMLAANGEEQTLSWIEGLVSNFARKPTGGDTDQLKAAAAGQCDIAIANTYYFGRLINSNDEADREIAAKLKIFWPNQADRGTHVNVSGAGVTKYAKNPENAIKLLEFLTSDSSQQWYSSINNEYPVVIGAPIADTLTQWGSFKQDSIDLTILGENNRTAVVLMDKAGWK